MIQLTAYDRLKILRDAVVHMTDDATAGAAELAAKDVEAGPAVDLDNARELLRLVNNLVRGLVAQARK